MRRISSFPMTFLSSLAHRFFSKLFGGGSSGFCHLLVHLPSISGNGQNGKARLSPGDIISSLNRLSNYSKREDLPISAISIERRQTLRQPRTGVLSKFFSTRLNSLV